MAAIDELMVALSSNPELWQAMTSATTPENAVKAAADAGYKVTSQELLEAYKSKIVDLSEDELASVTGGGNKNHNPVENNPVTVRKITGKLLGHYATDEL
ncbi:Nif11-like leader peptide family RiPP precursor [Synechococcus sp. BIOS-E4-1]|uniref:Nif11-like leader peptide family RiPP precursor n=1 Tax=Synechococcus sp. BIOS-E4-1 TaxID=1400864 RepID=UPI0016449832|nr:Nif11-like leader peptide family RiPP precursor [Synechococcus sp. BIOS-E4-1]